VRNERETRRREAADCFKISVGEDVKRVSVAKHVIPNVWYHKHNWQNRENYDHKPKRRFVFQFFAFAERVEDEPNSERQEARGYDTGDCLDFTVLKPYRYWQNQK